MGRFRMERNEEVEIDFLMEYLRKSLDGLIGKLKVSEEYVIGDRSSIQPIKGKKICIEVEFKEWK